MGLSSKLGFTEQRSSTETLWGHFTLQARCEAVAPGPWGYICWFTQAPVLSSNPNMLELRLPRGKTALLRAVCDE